MRYLFVIVDGSGSVYPQLALAERMRARGHGVRVLASRSLRRTITGAGFAYVPFSGGPDVDSTGLEGPMIRDWVDDRATVFAQLCDLLWFGPAASVAADVLAAVHRGDVDALVIDYFAPGAVAAAERGGIPSAVLWHTTFGEYDVWNQGLGALNAAREGLGLPAVGDVFQQFRAADHVLVLTTRDFDFALGARRLPANVQHVGPQFAPDAAPAAVDHEPPAPPLVLVSLSSAPQGQEDALQRIIDALAPLPVRALVTAGSAFELVATPSPSIEVRRWIRHADVLPDASLVITHAGLGTVMAAMAYGVPMLCMPMGRDQDGNAERVARIGNGRVIDAASSVAELREAVTLSLADDAVRRRARAIADAMRRAGQDDAGARALESLETSPGAAEAGARST